MREFDIQNIMVSFLAIVISLTVHEFAHAWTAHRLGDPTPGRHGRLTLNPVVLFRAHPFGALLMPLLGAFSGFLIGWAATPVNPALVRRSISRRKAEFLISFAGPASNVMLGIHSAVAYAFVAGLEGGAVDPLAHLAHAMVFANVILAVFNLIPIPPLDGFTVLSSSFPRSPALPFLNQYGTLILLVIVIYGAEFFGPVLRLANTGLKWLAS